MSGGGYKAIYVRVWNDEKFLSLSDDGKLLWFYILTCPHRHMSGIFLLDQSYVLADLRWKPRRLRAAWSELVAGGLILYDENSRVLFIPNTLKYDPLQNENQAKHVVRHLAALPKTPLMAGFCDAAIRFTTDRRSVDYLSTNLAPFMKGLDKPFDKPFYKGSETVSEQEPIPEPIPIPKKEKEEVKEPSREEMPTLNVGGGARAGLWGPPASPSHPKGNGGNGKSTPSFKKRMDWRDFIPELQRGVDAGEIPVASAKQTLLALDAPKAEVDELFGKEATI